MPTTRDTRPSPVASIESGPIPWAALSHSATDATMTLTRDGALREAREIQADALLRWHVGRHQACDRDVGEVRRGAGVLGRDAAAIVLGDLDALPNAVQCEVPERDVGDVSSPPPLRLQARPSGRACTRINTPERVPGKSQTEKERTRFKRR